MRGRFGFGMGFGGRGHFFDGPRMRRGDVKYLLLDVLKDGSKHGYEIINGLEGDPRGYRPSAGSVYPTLQMLEEGGYLTSEQIDGKKVYTITDVGRKLAEERGREGFDMPEGMKKFVEVRESMKKLTLAVVDGSRSSDDASVAKIKDILDKARKEVYAVLAES